MWYLIRRNPDSKVTLRYYSNISENPDFVFQDDYTRNWIESILDFTHIITVYAYDIYTSLNLLSLDDRFTITTLPNLPRNINSIDDVVLAYPELFL